MPTRHRLGSVVLASALGSLAGAQTIIYVDVNATPAGNGTQASPFTTIFDGYVAATNGDTVLVAPGTYQETLLILGKSIAIESTEGPDTTIIDGGGSDFRPWSACSAEPGNDSLVIAVSDRAISH